MGVDIQVDPVVLPLVSSTVSSYRTVDIEPRGYITPTDVLLISDSFIRAATNISDNVSGKLLLPAIREAQEIGLRGILGDALLDKLKSMMAEQAAIPFPYDALIREAQWYLAYSSLSSVCLLASVKIDNIGLVQVSDDHVSPISISDAYRMADYYRHRADYYCYRLQGYLLRHRADYPELSEGDCSSIKSNLSSAASCGLWLGGIRGRRIRR